VLREQPVRRDLPALLGLLVQLETEGRRDPRVRRALRGKLGKLARQGRLETKDLQDLRGLLVRLGRPVPRVLRER
jgi:hypothetical protein